MSATTDHAGSPLQFPCRFPIKAMGRRGGGLREAVEAIVRAHVPAEDVHELRERESRHGGYVSVTAVITARSRAQLDAIYLALSECSQVMMRL